MTPTFVVVKIPTNSCLVLNRSLCTKLENSSSRNCAIALPYKFAKGDLLGSCFLAYAFQRLDSCAPVEKSHEPRIVHKWFRNFSTQSDF